MEIGKFQIQNQLNITNRGAVFAGQIIEGKVKVGSKLTFKIDGKFLTLEIAAVEMGDFISTQEYFVGLMFKYESETQKEYFQKINIPEQIAIVSE